MSRVCQVTGRRPVAGNNRSHSLRATRRRFMPNVQTRRFWVHTCTGDSPQAIGFYTSCGFTPYKRAIEVADDPRLSGLLGRDKAPHVPVLGA